MLVAQIADPFNRAPMPSQVNTMHASEVRGKTPALPIGLFVEALIQGQIFDQLVLLPTSALLKNDQVAVLDEYDRLRIRTVNVLKRERKHLIIKSGLNAGERVLVSGLLQPIEGMHVAPKVLNENKDMDSFEDS
jgi:multidrug efflux pump subunit AcrA (membrane-fusion protein)